MAEYQLFVLPEWNSNFSHNHMGVSKNREENPPKWMVYNGSKPLLKWMIWGVPLFWKDPY